MTVASLLRDLRRAAGWHRRLLAAGLAAAAVAFGLEAVEPAPPPSELILAARDDLPGGTRLGPDDLTRVRLPPRAVPAGALRPGEPVRGRVLAGPVRSGEPLTDVRLLGPSLLARYGPGTVATPVRIADAASVRLLQPGDVVDVLAATGSALRLDGSALPVAATVAAGVPVLAVPAGGGDAGLGGGALVVLATSKEVAGRLAGAMAASRLCVVIRTA